ncbi:N-acetylneuraminate synthase family protein [Fusibacter sp. JL216-2]|uniref:N-acetylneuraminate synthase family protein n=1 Tax=Fusibacter sp. JL216-2 TaxID=3071453 RepID=UPI003D356514
MKSNYYTNEPYLIAETAYSFEGDSIYLMDQITQLSEEVDAVKFHMMFNLNEYMVKKHSVYNLLENWLLTEKEWKEILVKSKARGFDVIVLVDDFESVEFCMNNNELVDAIEIHAACINDKALMDKAIDFVNEYKKLFVVGISGFEIEELDNVYNYLLSKKINETLMVYGFQNYPTKIEEVNLKKIPYFRERYKTKIAYADHTEYNSSLKSELIMSAYTLGANVQEIHYVIDEGVERTDYITAINNHKLVDMKMLLKRVGSFLGDGNPSLSEGEKNYLKVRKVPVLAESVKKGECLSENHVMFKRVDRTEESYKFGEAEKYLGKRFVDDFEYEDQIKKIMFEE